MEYEGEVRLLIILICMFISFAIIHAVGKNLLKGYIKNFVVSISYLIGGLAVGIVIFYILH